MNLQRLEHHLKKRLTYPYIWGRRQSNKWDSKTNFIYHIRAFKELELKIKNLDEETKNYALTRWYNYWSAMGLEYIFSNHSIVTPNKNKFDKLVDFSVQNINFDHKTSVFPNGFHYSLEYALEHKKELILWLYENQSQQGRKHLENRLFIVLFDTNHGKHWKIKSEISFLKEKIDSYIKNFNSKKLIRINLGDGLVYSDIIWVIK